jgi:hypothetical protein
MFKKILVIAAVISLIVLTRIYPNIYALTNTPEGYVYSGQVSMYDPWDVNVYVGAINYGQEGHIMLRNQFTTSDYREAFIYFIYTAAGYVFRSPDPYTVFFVMSLVNRVAVCLAIFALSYAFIKKYWYSVLSMFLIARGGGFGWLSYILFGNKLKAADLAYTVTTYTGVLQKMHVGIGTILLLSAIISFFFFQQSKKKILGILSFISMSLLMFFYPYYLFVYMTLVGIYALFHLIRNHSNRICIFGILSLLVYLILAFFLYRNISLSGFSTILDESLEKLDIYAVVTGYGVFLLLFLVSLFVKKNQQYKQERRFLITWICVSFLLSYAPIGYSQLFLRGLYFPFVVLSLILIITIQSQITKRVLLIGFSILLPLTSIFVFFYRMMLVRTVNPWVYLHEETQEMFDFLSERRRDGILSSYRLGNFIPAKTNKNVFLGHATQTPDALYRYEKIKDFYSGSMTDSEALLFLRMSKTSFIVYGRDEKVLGGHIYPFLKQIFSNSVDQVYTY